MANGKCRVTASRPVRLVMALAAISLGLTTLATPAAAAGRRIVVTTTIQAAVNAASPGNTIIVPPGTYYESVLVNISDLTIVGSRGAVIDARGATDAIAVGTGRIGPGRDSARERPLTGQHLPILMVGPTRQLVGVGERLPRLVEGGDGACARRSWPYRGRAGD